MISRQIETLIQLSKTAHHHHQLPALFLKTSLDHNTYIISRFILTSLPISLHFTRSLFNNVMPPLFAYNTLIRAYAKTSCSIESIKLFDEMLKTGLRPDNLTYPFVVKASDQCLLIGVGGSVHSLIFKVGLHSDKYIGNTLLRMYAACKEIDFAKALFDEMPE
ncbi:hypothetical protein CISIN_1g045917mg [Citrus sinensis]|uniref:Pentacotripeptide-repeat region of PRORP domain-containing protein n=2 Tax=Citrus TaxID=2706 RepID=A0A067F6H5_CITSI|nr:hypothetical protein CISIN_1g045917mg [Citrus sinensis]